MKLPEITGRRKSAKCYTNLCVVAFLPWFAATVLPGAYALIL